MVDGVDMRAELEARIRLELNRRLANINSFLQQHAAECAKVDRLRDENESEIRNQLRQAEQQLRVWNRNNFVDVVGIVSCHCYSSLGAIQKVRMLENGRFNLTPYSVYFIPTPMRKFGRTYSP